MLALGEIDDELKARERLYAAAFFHAQALEIRRIADMAREGIQVRSLVGDRARELFGERERLRRRLLDIMKGAAEFGRRQVEREIDLQEGGRGAT